MRSPGPPLFCEKLVLALSPAAWTAAVGSLGCGGKTGSRATAGRNIVWSRATDAVWLNYPLLSETDGRSLRVHRRVLQALAPEGVRPLNHANRVT